MTDSEREAKIAEMEAEIADLRAQARRFKESEDHAGHVPHKDLSRGVDSLTKRANKLERELAALRAGR